MTLITYFALYWLLAGVATTAAVAWEDPKDSHTFDRIGPLAFMLGGILLPIFLLFMLPPELIRKLVAKYKK